MTASILILCWNHERYLKQCIDSLVAQTFKDFEVIFLDNLSTDNSYETAKALLEASGLPYKAFQNTSPLSVAVNANFLLSKSSGKYIFPFSSDDWMAPENISKKVALLQQKPDVGLVFGGGWLYYEEENRYEEVDSSKFKNVDMSRNLLIDPDSYFFCGPAYPAAVIKSIGGWDENLIVEDLDMNIRISLKYEIDFVPESLIYYRRHTRNYSGNNKLMLKGFRQYYKKYKGYKQLPMNQWLSNFYNLIAYQAAFSGEYRAMTMYLTKSYLLFPRIEIIRRFWPYTKIYLYSIATVRRIWESVKNRRINLRIGSPDRKNHYLVRSNAFSLKFAKSPRIARTYSTGYINTFS